MMCTLVLILFLSPGIHSLRSSSLEQRHKVQYLTYTKENQKNPLDIRDVAFDDGQTTLFIVHGYSPTSLDHPLKLVSDIFNHDRNVSSVVVVSWIDYATGKIRYETILMIVKCEVFFVRSFFNTHRWIQHSELLQSGYRTRSKYGC